MNNVNQSQNLFSNNTYYNSDGYYINYLDWDNSVWFSLCSNGTCYQYNSLPNQIIENEWFNLVITKNNGLIQIYIDGQNVTADSWNITQGDDITQYYVDPNSELRIGIDGDDVQPFFGNLDEILLIKEALSEQEISDYMSSGIMNSDIDIVGNWKLNESSGSTAFDFSGKGNHASLNGPVRSQDVPSLSEPYVTVTFNVDMDGVEVSEDGVSMVGVFGTPGDSPMSDDDGDGVWTRTVELEKNSSFSYKFVSCLSWDCMEDLSGQSCATGEYSDRYLETGEQDTTVNAVFGSCESNISSTTNYALNFDGQDDYVNINYNANLALNNEMTISGWVKIPSDHNSLWGSVVGGHNGYGYILYAGSNSGSSNGNLWLEVRDGGSVSGTTDLRDNNWHHIAVTYDGNTARAFVDGQLEGENSFETGFQGTSGYPLKFGYVNHSVGSNEHFPGILDELSIYNIALDQQTIQSYMVSELLGYEPGLVGYWNFNEVQNSTVYDITGNGHDGTIYGTELSGDAAPIGPPPAVDGCTDPYAENYDLYANTNDGTCEYSQEPVTFTKEDYADASLEENQDRITASVWITRGDNQPLYNAAFESYSDHGVSPSGTIWAPGQTALQTNTNGYQSFRDATGGNHQNLPGRTMSMYIIQEDLFYDVEFHSWTSNNNGGGFSYTRTPAEINSFEYPLDAVYFEKVDFADPLLEQNQDRITDRTWITRGNEQGIYNPFSENSYYFESSDEVYSAPSNTLWAYGLTDYVEGEYRPFKEAVQSQMSMSSLNDGGHTFSMFIVSENLFYDVEFHSWTCCQNGGGFSYTRTDQSGQSITFTKEDYADWTLEENQDRITDNVWITRQDQNPLFNIAEEQDYYSSSSFYYDAFGSPENTESVSYTHLTLPTNREV